MATIKHIDITEDGNTFFVRYYSGSERSYTMDTLPEKARIFLLDRKEQTEKQLAYKLPVFGPGKHNYNIVREQLYYRIVD